MVSRLGEKMTNTAEILNLKHLGSNSSYKYQNVESSLLEVINRNAARELHKLPKSVENLYGFDLWNAFEFSTFIDNRPIFGKVSFRYDAKSTNLVESKSLKLYLNSFNSVNFDSKDSPSFWCTDTILDIIKKDLKEKVNVELEDMIINWYPVMDAEKESKALGTTKEFSEIGAFIPKQIISTNLSEMTRVIPEKLSIQSFSPRTTFIIAGVSSNCMVTNQPDWGTLVFNHDGEMTAKNLKEFADYLISFRDDSHFHEQCCDSVALMIEKLFKAKRYTASIMYTRRGGISITPVRTTAEGSNVGLGSKLGYKDNLNIIRYAACFYGQ